MILFCFAVILFNVASMNDVYNVVCIPAIGGHLHAFLPHLFSAAAESLYVSLGASLEQVHIFALAHILRRPIIVYGIKYVKSYHGDNIGLARFQG